MSKSTDFFTGVDDRLLMLEQMVGESKAITKMDLDVVSKKAKALKALISEDTELIAEYKIEIQFEKRRRTDRDTFAGVVVVFKTGFLSGGGDEILYPCPSDSCNGYISFDDRSHYTGETVCPKCNSMWLENQLSEIRGYKLDINRWSEVIAAKFRALNNKADIYIKMHLGDLRQAAIKETLVERRGEDLYNARKRVVLRYSLDAIIKDTMGGSSLESRIKSLLRA